MLVSATILCGSQYSQGKKRFQPGPRMKTPMMISPTHITRKPNRKTEMANLRSLKL